MRIKSLLSGLYSFVPILYSSTGSASRPASARYCYSVWLRHLVTLFGHGIKQIPETITEIGPGNSLGTGLCGLLSGVQKYYSCDIKQFYSIEADLKIFDELVELFRHREPIPDDQEFPNVRPILNSYEFPYHIFPELHLQSCLSEERLCIVRQSLRESVTDTSTDRAIQIKFFIPSEQWDVLRPGTVDLVYSQAVMEYLDNPHEAYHDYYQMLRPGGVMSHQIDFRSHGLANEWDGHWVYSNFTWKIICGRRPAIISRLPHSYHIEAQIKAGFTIIADIKNQCKATVERGKLSKRFSALSDEDRSTGTSHIISARRPTTHSEKDKSRSEWITSDRHASMKLSTQAIIITSFSFGTHYLHLFHYRSF